MRHAYLLALGLAACGPDIYLTDDIDLTWDFEITLDRFEGELHTPYVKGAPVRLYVTADDDEYLDGWRLYSTDSSVFAIDSVTVDYDGHGLTAVGRAVGEGIAGIVIDNAEGRRVGGDGAEVVAPDRVELDAHGYMILDRDIDAPVADVRIVEGGTATYLVRYFRGDRLLHGNSVLSASAADTAGFTAQARQSFLFENREWLTINAGAPGTDNVVLRADGEPFAAVPVITVPETDLVRMALLGQSEKGAEDGDWRVLLAQSYDAADRKVFGVDFAWMIDGVMQTEAGDLYRYEFKKGAYRMVTAERSGLEASVEIQSERGFVDSSNNIGCNAGGGAGGLVAFGLLGLLSRRRRR